VLLGIVKLRDDLYFEYRAFDSDVRQGIQNQEGRLFTCKPGVANHLIVVLVKRNLETLRIAGEQTKKSDELNTYLLHFYLSWYSVDLQHERLGLILDFFRSLWLSWFHTSL